MEPTLSPQNQDENEDIIKILKSLGSIQVHYPPELLAARRADFVVHLRGYSRGKVKSRPPLKNQLIRQIEELQAGRVDYPPELLAARRAVFLSQIDQVSAAEVTEQLSPQDQKIIHLLNSLKTTEAGYPASSLAMRRSAFRKRIRRLHVDRQFENLRAFFRDLFEHKNKLPAWPSASIRQASFIVAGLVLAVMVGSWLLREPERLFKPGPSPAASVQPKEVGATATPEIAAVICKAGDSSPLCPPAEMDSVHNLAYTGNGAARPAVAKDEMASAFHDAAYVNDGREGSSWVSESPNSWIKIDFGKVTTINTVALDTAHLNSSEGSSPGQFVIAVALSDVYSDGDSSNDFVEYAQVFNSEQAGLDGALQGAETITARFKPVQARYLKITFQKEGTAIDEVRVFMAKPGELAAHPTRKPKDEGPALAITLVPANTALPAYTPTSVPTDTPLPTDTPVPTLTDTPQPSDTPAPTDTQPPAYTSTPVPTDTQPPADTPTPAPTDGVTPMAESTGTPATGIAP